VLVSHDLGALNTYCDRVLLLQKGELIADGGAAAVTAQYRRMVAEMSDDTHDTPETAPDSTVRWGSREVEITAVHLLDGGGHPHTSFATGAPMTVAIDYVVNAPVDNFVFGLAFKRSDGVNLSGPNTRDGGIRVRGAPPGTRGTVRYRLPALELLSAGYLLTAAVYDEHLVHAYDHIEDAVTFRAVDDRGRLGMVDLGGSWSQGSAEPGGGAAPPATQPAAAETEVSAASATSSSSG